ncbi:hypothetical protein NSQ10_12255 [Bacillus sp. FSL R5-0432]|uniref:hypothetical protein n=1 Tax=unclassified Bacillus (in: firmicutes) TaxID=185979 RepID=UPI00057CBF0D|nr:hypothetical protein [Bacillus sp. WP8]AIZ60917.1 hypothetical protein QR42_11785 [Bacillus sp. WP8]
MPETVIAIPGFWSHHLKELEELNDYIYVNHRIIHKLTGTYYDLEVVDHIDQLSETFLPKEQFNAEELKQIDKHQTCLYIIGMTESLEEINALVQCTTVLLKIDGTAIKVESSGRSFMKESWLSLMEKFNTYQYMTSIVQESDVVYVTSGFQQFGEPEMMFEGFHADEIERHFLNWINKSIQEKRETLKEKIIYDEGQQIKLDLIEYDFYPEDDLFYNPYGVVVFNK